jgi:hypothetical protein
MGQFLLIPTNEDMISLNKRREALRFPARQASQKEALVNCHQRGCNFLAFPKVYYKIKITSKILSRRLMRSELRSLLWISGVAAIWVGALLAQINGYPVKTMPSLGVALVVAGGQYTMIRRLGRGRDLLGGLALGILPVFLGFYLQNQHWVSELFVLGLLLSLASLNALLAQRWYQEWMFMAAGVPDQPLGAAPRGLVFTLVNIFVIGGLLLIWYFPASPLPGRWGAWGLILLAIINQEFIKRKYYASGRGSTILAWTATGFGAGLSLWLVAVLYLRGQG